VYINLVHLAVVFVPVSFPYDATLNYFSPITSAQAAHTASKQAFNGMLIILWDHGGWKQTLNSPRDGRRWTFFTHASLAGKDDNPASASPVSSSACDGRSDRLSSIRLADDAVINEERDRLAARPLSQSEDSMHRLGGWHGS
jgi:hypothetical protein